MAFPVALLGRLVLAGGVYQRLRRYFKDSVDRLVEGCVVAHSMWWEQVEHSGIHVGGHGMVSLLRHGRIALERPKEFLRGASNGLIYVSCRGKFAVGSPRVASRASEMVGERRNYSVLFDNCHQFTSGCLTGDFENADNAFTMLKGTVAKELGADNWRIWDREGAIQEMCARAICEIVQSRERLERIINSDFGAREQLLGCAFDRLRTTYGLEDIDGFLNALGEIAPDLPWKDIEQFDQWMRDDDTVLDLR